METKVSMNYVGNRKTIHHKKRLTPPNGIDPTAMEVFEK
jgi:hypothetical protein